MPAYYNEFNPEAAAMLRQLIKDGFIAPGDVDERSITEVKPDDLKEYIQCHFFAGIGGWSMALRAAGWADTTPVWTGSAPCQPFSSAGRQKGKDDERHLFPAWFELIKSLQPATIFGEQVASAVGHGWLDLVCESLEGVYFGHNRESLHRLQDPETFDRVSEILWKVKRGRSASLQGLPEGVREEVAQFIQRIQGGTTSETQRVRQTVSAELDVQKQGCLFGIGMPQTLHEEEHPVQLRPLHTATRETNCNRGLRGERLPIGQHAIGGEEVQHTILGQDKPESRIPLRECEGGGVCGECCNGGLGRRCVQTDNEKMDGQLDDTEKQNATGTVRSEPQTVFAHGWLDDVYTGLEAEGYACGAAVLPACSVGAPHRRDRLWFVAHLQSIGRGQEHTDARGCCEGNSAEQGARLTDNGYGTMAHTANTGLPQRRESPMGRPQPQSESERCSSDGDVDHTQQPGLEGYTGHGKHGNEPGRQHTGENGPIAAAGFWSSGVWHHCPDEKHRLIKCAIRCLDDGIPLYCDYLNGNGYEELQKAKAEVEKYATMEKTRPGEILRKVWRSYDQEVHQQQVGGLQQLLPAPILFTFLRQLSRSEDAEWLLFSGEEAQETLLRSLRVYETTARAPYRWQLPKQCAEQPANTLHILSHVLAQHAGKAWNSCIQNDASALLVKNQKHRRPILHALGNAIVPQVAAEFIKATM